MVQSLGHLVVLAELLEDLGCLYLGQGKGGHDLSLLGLFVLLFLVFSIDREQIASSVTVTIQPGSASPVFQIAGW